MKTNKVSFKMSKLSKCLTMLAFFGTIQASAMGTKDGGGGNICYINNKPVLLEFADLRHELNEPGMKFESDDMIKVFGFGSLEHITYGKIEKRIKAILDANYKYSPFVVSLFRSLAPEMAFSFTSINIRVPVKADLSTQPNCQRGNVKASVVYFPSHLAFADLEKMNSLDLDSQAGLILHEAARFMQTFQENGTDLELQNMIRTMFDVYKGRSQASLDTDNFNDTFRGNVEVSINSTASTDLCLRDFYYYEAGKAVYERRGLVLPAAITPHFTNIGYLEDDIKEEISGLVNFAIEGAPAAAKEACELSYKVAPWKELKAKLQNIQQRLNYHYVRLENQEEIEILKERLSVALENPERNKNWNAEAMSFIEHQAQFIFNRRTKFNADLIMLDINVTNYMEHKNDLFPSAETEALIKDTRLRACTSKANLTEWLTLGAANLRQYQGEKIVNALFSPNPKCK